MFNFVKQQQYKRQEIWETVKGKNERMSLKDETGQLFDRDSDPHELKNLWFDPDHATVKADLMERMMRERMRLGETLPLPQRFA